MGERFTDDAAPGRRTHPSELSTEFGAGSPALVEALVAAVESAFDAVMITDADLEPPGPRIMRDTTAFKRRLADAERQARTDELTGLANRRHFSAALAAAMADPEIAARAALLSLDIDKFKQVNDVHGHPAGDAVLREVARRIREAVREQDIVARTGGEEFAVLAIGPGGDQGMRDLADWIRRSVEREPVSYGGGTLPLTISVGVALAADSGGRIDGLVDRSDRALYEAKRTGRDRVVFASTAPGSS